MSDASTLLDRLDAQQVAAVEDIIDAAEEADGTPPVNEAGRLALGRPDAAHRHVLATAGGAVVGYGQLEAAPGQATGQLVVHPRHRGRGHGRRLLETLLDASTTPLQVWAMSNSAAARRLAARTGLVAQRELLVMERPLDETLDELSSPPLPPGVTLRSFRPGADEQAWLALNAAAFAHHPEQGRMTRADLDQRMAEDWFDPAGFLLADAAGELLGFHWTKQHPHRLGEVYVLGVAPAAGGHGLGKTLLAAGLRQLRAAGNVAVELYVEAEHTAAVGLYRGYGFVTAGRDVMYGPALTPA